MVEIEPIRNEEREKRPQGQTVTVRDTQNTNGDQQSNGEDANNLVHGQGFQAKVIKYLYYIHKRYLRVLSKGLKFTPTPRKSTIEIEKDIHDFTRKIRWAEYFVNEKEKDIAFDEETQPLLPFIPPLCNKGSW